MRWGGWPAAIASAAAGTLYAATLAPGLTWAHAGADGGDLLAAALTGGIPHPPGYPTYQILLRAAIALFPGEPARAGNWLSALCMAAAAGLLADLARRNPADCGTLRRGLSATAGALAWAAAPAVWGQATITEVYGLQALAVMAVLWLLWRWREAAGRRWLALAGLAFGLGLGNHLSLALLAPAGLLWLWAGKASLRDAAVGAALTAAGLSVYAYLPLAAAGHPPVNWGDPSTPARFAWTASGWVYRELVFGLPLADWPGRLAALAGELLRQYGVWGALLALAGLWQIDRRRHDWWRTTVLVALAFAAYALGYRTDDASVYLIPAWAMVALWLAAGIDWAASQVVAGAAAPAGEDPAEHPERSRVGPRRSRRARSGQLPRSASLRQAQGKLFGWTSFVKRLGSQTRSGFAVRLSPKGCLPVFRAGQTAARWRKGQAAAVAVATVALIALPGVSIARFWPENDLRRDTAARDFVAAALAQAEPGAVILTATDEPTFALWYAIYGLGQRRDLTPLNVNLFDFEWYRLTLHAHHLDAMSGVDVCGAAPDLAQLVLRGSAARPFYRAEPLALALPGTVESPSGALVRIEPE